MDYFSSRYGRPDTCEVDQGAGSEEQDRAGGSLFRFVWGVLSAAAQTQTSMQQLSASWHVHRFVSAFRGEQFVYLTRSFAAMKSKTLSE